MSERSLIEMAVMSQKVNLGFEVAPGKREQFLKESAQSKGFETVMLRAAKNICGFEKRVDNKRK